MYKCLIINLGKKYGKLKAYDPSIVTISETHFGLRHIPGSVIDVGYPKDCHVYGDYEIEISHLVKFEKALNELSTSDLNVVEVKF